MTSDEIAAAEKKYQDARSAREELQPRYDQTLALKPLSDVDPVPTMSSEDISVARRYIELEEAETDALDQLRRLRD